MDADQKLRFPTLVSVHPLSGAPPTPGWRLRQRRGLLAMGDNGEDLLADGAPPFPPAAHFGGGAHGARRGPVLSG